MFLLDDGSFGNFILFRTEALKQTSLTAYFPNSKHLYDAFMEEPISLSATPQ